MAFGEAVALALAAKIRLVEDGEWTERRSTVGQHDGSAIVELHLAVAVVLGRGTVNGDILQISSLGGGRTNGVNDDDGVLGVHDVNGAPRGKRFSADDVEVDVIGEAHGLGHLRHTLFRVVCPRICRQTDHGKCQEEESFHNRLI